MPNNLCTSDLASEPYLTQICSRHCLLRYEEDEHLGEGAMVAIFMFIYRRIRLEHAPLALPFSSFKQSHLVLADNSRAS
jgi:hypothetical protein